MKHSQSIENLRTNPTDIENQHEDLLTEDMTFVLFGATGDLAKRKLFPALYNLFIDGKLPKSISIIGLGRSHSSDEAFQSRIENTLHEFSRRPVQVEHLPRFLANFRYCTFDATTQDSYSSLLDLIQTREKEYQLPENRLFYLSVAPSLIDDIATGLHDNGITKTTGWKRLLVEKPFGNNFQSARQLNEVLSQSFHDNEVYRIDHFLGKPIVQNLTTLAATNPIFDSLLNHKKIANIQITAFETVGVETRAEYYDTAGALLDMAQNHLLQLFMMSALHLRKQSTAHEIRKEKVKLMESLRLIFKDSVSKEVIRGQYEAGTVLNELVLGYKDEPGVPPSSMNDTYFAARLWVDDSRWKGIPFYIRTGKRMLEKSTKIVIEYKMTKADGPSVEGITPNLLIIEISPQQGISLKMNLLDPLSKQFDPVTIDFHSNAETQPEAYELLLADALNGDATFFANWKEVEISWQWIQPILEAFQENSVPLHTYPAGSMGPEAANELLQEQKFIWW